MHFFRRFFETEKNNPADFIAFRMYLGKRVRVMMMMVSQSLIFRAVLINQRNLLKQKVALPDQVDISRVFVFVDSHHCIQLCVELN